MMSLRRHFVLNLLDNRRYIMDQSRAVTTRSSAGIIIIGDEILKAQVKDTNSILMCRLLYENGVKVKKISVISDNVEEIGNEIVEFSKKYTFVFTSGGIGPTHDDMTYEGLARAFDDTLHHHPKLVDIIKNQFGFKNRLSPSYKMAYIPTKASLKFSINEETGKPIRYPCVNLENVYVFPGSPIFFERSFRSVCKELFSGDESFSKDELYIKAPEESFADALTTAAKEFPDVSFGSYPIYDCRYYTALVTVESDNQNRTEEAKRRFRELAPPGIFVEYDRIPK